MTRSSRCGPSSPGALGAQDIKLARRSDRGITLVYLDLDRFKTIDVSLGHPMGDRPPSRGAAILRDPLEALPRRADAARYERKRGRLEAVTP